MDWNTGIPTEQLFQWQILSNVRAITVPKFATVESNLTGINKPTTRSAAALARLSW
ncbi:hypothetical protein J6590_001345 [Homalodisca vitripennis]|nr:hypothetical protein J6590_001345 [Homalodisca vitripennis]